MLLQLCKSLVIATFASLKTGSQHPMLPFQNQGSISQLVINVQSNLVFLSPHFSLIQGLQSQILNLQHMTLNPQQPSFTTPPQLYESLAIAQFAFSMSVSQNPMLTLQNQGQFSHFVVQVQYDLVFLSPHFSLVQAYQSQNLNLPTITLTPQ